MHEWLVGSEAVAAVVLLLVLALVVLAARRRWLARQGGTFECSLQLRQSLPGSSWALGVARYNEENLEWFRFFSYSATPRKVFPRAAVNVVDNREPTEAEAASLYAGQRIVSIETIGDSGVETWQLAMSGESLTGLLSWLEAAPPGVVGY
jgi:hypothetical protein